MGMPVVMGATTMCTMGAAPSTLVVAPTNMTTIGAMPAATIMDNKPLANIMPFGMCMSMANPVVAAATAAALGILTPMPCVPMTPAPWLPGSLTVLIGNLPALNNTSKCMCVYGGVISVTFGGAPTATIP